MWDSYRHTSTKVANEISTQIHKGTGEGRGFVQKRICLCVQLHSTDTHGHTTGHKSKETVALSMTLNLWGLEGSVMWSVKFAPWIQGHQLFFFISGVNGDITTSTNAPLIHSVLFYLSSFCAHALAVCVISTCFLNPICISLPQGKGRLPKHSIWCNATTRQLTRHHRTKLATATALSQAHSGLNALQGLVKTAAKTKSVIWGGWGNPQRTMERSVRCWK